MCPSIENLTCYIGAWQPIIEAFATAIVLGLVFGAVVGIVEYAIKNRR